MYCTMIGNNLVVTQSQVSNQQPRPTQPPTHYRLENESQLRNTHNVLWLFSFSDMQIYRQTDTHINHNIHTHVRQSNNLVQHLYQ